MLVLAYILFQAYNELEELANHKDDEINQLKKQIEALRSSSLPPAVPTIQLVDDDEDFATTEGAKLQGQISSLTADLAAIARQRDESLQQLTASRSQTEQLRVQITSLQTLVTSLQQQNAQLHAQVQEKEKLAVSGKQSPVGDGRDLKISKLEMQLREEKARYDALEKEQEELLSVLATTELQNNNLQERIRIYESRTHTQ
jgi:chromosome segregation ATPase